MNYEVGKIYPLNQEAVNQIKRGFFGANFILNKPVDLQLGRRYTGNNSWEFWLTDGRKVSLSFGEGNILSVSKKADNERPTLGQSVNFT